jgi:cytochrome c biogenesis protein CcdA
MTLLFAYLAGLLVLINPCVLPVLPIVLASALQAHRLGPVALASGLALSFVGFGLSVALLAGAFGLSSDLLGQIAALMMVGFGLVLLVPQFGAQFNRATAGFAATADRGIDEMDRTGLGGQFLTGVLLGAVWSPCVGPTLGGAIALAATGGATFGSPLVMMAFAAGVATVMLALAYGARATLLRRRAALRSLAEWAKPAMGAVLAGVGLIILFGLHHRIEAWALSVLPIWLQDLSVQF